MIIILANINRKSHNSLKNIIGPTHNTEITVFWEITLLCCWNAVSSSMEDDTWAELYKKQYKEEKEKKKILSSIVAKGILKEAEGNKPIGI